MVDYIINPHYMWCPSDHGSTFSISCFQELKNFMKKIITIVSFLKYDFKMFSLTCLVTKIIQAFRSHNRVRV